jgi:hypothetical protein
VRYTSLHQAVPGLIAILALVLMVEGSGYAAGTRQQTDFESQSDGSEYLGHGLQMRSCA